MIHCLLDGMKEIQVYNNLIPRFPSLSLSKRGCLRTPFLKCVTKQRLLFGDCGLRQIPTEKGTCYEESKKEYEDNKTTEEEF